MYLISQRSTVLNLIIDYRVTYVYVVSLIYDLIERMKKKIILILKNA